ncbi:MAG: hypothetical protein GF381_04310 [Candidatus Pacebacteria bacterium]|nr:hypothetical protein [Candidatus Paceibacterota bacterium]
MSKSSNNYCRFYLVRHGQTEWNVKKIMQGHQDSPLTQRGREQARMTNQLLQKINFDHVFSSDLMRAHQTAKIMAADRDLAVKTSKLLRETYLGPFEGKRYQFFHQQLKKSLEYRQSLPVEERLAYQVHPECETSEQTATRLLTFMRETAVGYPNKKVLVVSHSGTIRAALIKLGFARFDEIDHGAVKNTGYAVIDSDGVDFFVRETYGIEVNRKTQSKN